MGQKVVSQVYGQRKDKLRDSMPSDRMTKLTDSIWALARDEGRSLERGVSLSQSR